LISMLLAPLVTAFASGESTHFIVSVYVDGSARWVVEHRYPLRSEEDVEAFRVVAANVSKELSETYRLRLQTVIQEASRLTGRAMGLTEFAVHTSTQTTVTGSVGIIVVEFVWTGFAAVADGKISVGMSMRLISLDSQDGHAISKSSERDPHEGQAGNETCSEDLSPNIDALDSMLSAGSSIPPIL
jgi:hypothetical protein